MEYLVVNEFEFEWQIVDTIEKAIEVGTDFAICDEGYTIESSGDIKIYEYDLDHYDIFEFLDKEPRPIKQIEINIIDRKSNYSYESEEDAIWHADQEAIDNEDYWPYDADSVECATHKWVDVF